MSSLLARYADCIFWMARYVERAENLARILDVTHGAARRHAGAQDWAAILEINSDLARFTESGRPIDAETVVHFYVADTANPTSILNTVTAARENARTLRPVISTEMWSQLNVFYNWLRTLAPADLTLPERSRLFAAIKANCQTHTGIAEGTFFRDQGWYFYQLGRCLERADQTTRLLDVKLHRLVAAASPASPLEPGEEAALLRSAAGYHAFRRVHPRGLVLTDVVGFLLLHSGFPRSVHYCVNELHRFLRELRQRHALRGGGEALERLDEIRIALRAESPKAILQSGLHDILDWIQRRLIDTTDLLTRDFFGRPG